MSNDREIRFSRSRQRGDIRTWKNRLLKVPAFIVGNGPSLNDEDISSLSFYFTIGINRSFYKIDTSILMWQDASLWFSERKKILQTKSIKYCAEKADPDNRFLNFKLEPGPFILPNDAKTLYGTGTSGPLAVQLAYTIGCDPIILLGFDCKPRKNVSNFYGRNKFHSINTMNQCLAGLNWIKSLSNCNIISCSDNDLFERKPLTDVISSIDDKYKKDFDYWKKLLIG